MSMGLSKWRGGSGWCRYPSIGGVVASIKLGMWCRWLYVDGKRTDRDKEIYGEAYLRIWVNGKEEEEEGSEKAAQSDAVLVAKRSGNKWEREGWTPRCWLENDASQFGIMRSESRSRRSLVQAKLKCGGWRDA